MAINQMTSVEIARDASLLQLVEQLLGEDM
jgi:hypothetical protein